MAIKLIAIDIDGTLLNSKREITPRVKAALNTASAQGVYVVLCTGRPYPGVEGLLQELNLVNDHDYVVTYNGTLVQQTGSKKALVRFSMTHDDLERVNDYATKYNVHYHAIDEEAIYVPTATVGKYSIHESELVGMPIVHQLYKDIPTDKEFVKIMFVDEPEVLEELIPNLSDDFKSRYNIFRSAGFYLEVIHPEASKGKAVHHLADKLGLTRDEVMCLGDHENDRDMIEYAGLGVAMGNAIDSIKEIANFVTTTNDEDGVAVAVEKFVLKQGELVMLHEMTLFPKPYASIASGQKTIELRLYDEKRQSIQIGDQIRFTNTQDASQTTLCEVVQLHVFKNFAELYENLPLLKCGYTPEDVVNAHPDDMLTYYSKEKQAQYGVVGIELKRI